ncbi:MAG: triose-phosphate isomerase [Candidatus Parcubacteria bacterium]|nr:triose-phosphate isomerase [Candidatus Parcubacteria bacterium]
MKPLIVANWKCNPSTFAEAEKLFLAVSRGASKTGAEVVICPPFVFIPGLSAITKNPVKLGAQDAFFQEGAFTSQISINILKQFGCKYIIIGHSEKRALGETNKIINKKIKACLENNIIPVFCIGENRQERRLGKTSKILKSQLKEGLKGISPFNIGKLVIAYEPIWAIGTGNACDTDKAKEANIFIKKTLTDFYSGKNIQKVRIIYGGSTNPDNALSFIKDAGMDGLLPGGASLDAKKFVAILNKF